MPGQNSEEELDKYINDMSGITDDDSNAVGPNDGANDGDQLPDNTPDNASTDAGTQDQSADIQGAAQQPQADGTKGKQQEQGKQTPAQQPLRPLGDGVFEDGKGNIVDQNGALVARGGFAARMYQTNRRLRAQLETQTTQLNEISAQVGEVKALATSIRSYGLDNNDVAQAMDIAARLKRGDAVGAAKEVLAIITAQGYNVTDLLGNDVGDSIEMRAMKRMLDERFAPIQREEQSRQRQTEAEAQGRAEYNKFVSQNEYADVHASALVSLMQREQINPQTAYNRLFQFAVSNGLDFSQPLGPQIEARRAQQQKPNGGQGQQAHQRPMPNGAVTRNGGAVPALPLANADDDWGSIIHEVQRTMGNA